MMEFASRYELEDPLLTTTVETFVAKDRETQERVMVHVFSARENGLSASSSPEEILARFHQLTRATVRIRAVGVDSGTGYAYVVTPEIDTDYIAVWGTDPTAALAPMSTAIFTSQVGDVSTSARSIPEDATAAPIADFSGPPAPVEPFVPPAAPPLREPGSFTKEFLALQSRAKANPQSPLSRQFAVAPKANVENAAISPPTPANEPGGFTEVFRAAENASIHAEPPAPLARDAKPMGSPEIVPRSMNLPPAVPPAQRTSPAEGPSFTGMFGLGPPEPSPKPHASPRATPEVAPKPEVGAFTSMFGTEERKPHLAPSPIPTPTPVQPPPKAGAFTAMFGPEEAKAHLEPKANAGAFTRMFEAKEEPAAAANKPAVPNTPNMHPSGPPPAPAAPPPIAGVASAQPAAGSAPATRFFKGYDVVVPPKAPLPVGPSEYTRVVRFSDVVKETAPPPVPPQPGASVPPAGVPGIPPIPTPSFQPTPMPNPYQIPPVAMPHYTPPQMPGGQPFGMPGVSPPQMPPMQVPQMQWQQPAPPMPPPQYPAAPPQKSWMPLVILFLGLTVLALLVVLLFALKGH